MSTAVAGGSRDAEISSTADMATALPERVADGFSFLEGPRWHEGKLYVSDFYTHRVLVFDEDGSYTTLCEVPGRPSGLGFAPDDSLLIVSMTDHKLLRLAGGSLSTVADLSALAPGHCNDLLVDSAGRSYVGNFGWDAAADPTVQPTVLLLVGPDGTVDVAASDLVFPNGAVLTEDGRTMLLSETFASRISAFDVDADGALSNRRTWAAFGNPGRTIPDTIASGLPLPDGMALDAEGAVWIGHAAGRGPLRIAEGGEILDEIGTDELSVYAVALGGSDRRTLFMCASPPLLETDPSTDHRAALYRCRVDVPGAGLP
jgi:sugar lactone lactonase YvrE